MKPGAGSKAQEMPAAPLPDTKLNIEDQDSAQNHTASVAQEARYAQQLFSLVHIWGTSSSGDYHGSAVTLLRRSLQDALLEALIPSHGFYEYWSSHLTLH